MPSLLFTRSCSILLVLCVTACGDKPAAAPEPAAPEPGPTEPAAPSAAAPAPTEPPPSAAKDPAPSAAPALAPDAKLAAPAKEASAKQAAKSPKPAAASVENAPVENAASPSPAQEAKAAPAAPGPCGEKGQPRCPLQAWMEDHLQTALDAKDLPALAKGLTRAASFAPDPSWNDGAQGWSALTNGAADSAKKGDFAAVQASCKSCHKAWRAKYKQAFRTRPIAD